MNSVAIIKKGLLSGLLCLFSFTAVAQPKYWVFFTDKPADQLERQWVSDQTLRNRCLLSLPLRQYSDMEVNRAYTDSLSGCKVQVINRSKWLNAVTARLNPEQLSALSKLGFIKKIEAVDTRIFVAAEGDIPVLDAVALDQVNGKAFAQQNLTGKNVLVGVIDGRFANADQNKELAHIFNAQRIRHVKDFIEHDEANIYKEEALEDWHGTVVWQRISGLDAGNQTAYGLAKDASFYLARVDNPKIETRAEEDYWVAAIEWMDSLGVRLVNSSLGYSLDHDDPKENYKPEEMNGNTSGVGKAAQIATQQKGMILVVSAGNEGANENWGIVTTPGDAEGVITVGATAQGLWLKPTYSAVGPEFLSYIKPNVACYTPSGTSLAAPIITGMVSCMLEKKPDLGSSQIKALIEKSGHLYPYGNNYLGYGVPDAAKLLKLIEQPDAPTGATEEIHYPADRPEEYKRNSQAIVLKGEKYAPGPVVLFHKKDDKTVVHQWVRASKRNKFIVERPENVKRTTVGLKSGAVEIFWE